MLGAAPGQTIIADSTTVVLYKLIRAALAAVTDPARTEIVLDTDNFPTDRYLVEGIAREEGLTLRWIDADPASGVTVEQVRAATGPATAVVVLSQIAYRSGFLADLPAHHRGRPRRRRPGGVGPVPLRRVGGDRPGRRRRRLRGRLHLQVPERGTGLARVRLRQRTAPGRRCTQPIWGWMGRKDAFEMGPGYEAAPGIRGFLSGTPAIFGMLAMRGTLDLIEEAGMAAVREKSRLLTALRPRTLRRLARRRPAWSCPRRGIRNCAAATSPSTTRPSGK